MKRIKTRDKMKIVKKRANVTWFKKTCSFCKKEVEIDYKNIGMLTRYVSSKGKIFSRRISGNCAKHQRKIAREIKRARFLALLPYVQH